MTRAIPDITPLAVPAGSAAAMLSMSVNTFYARVKDGVLPPARMIGGKKLWAVRELETAVLNAPCEGDSDIVADLDKHMGL